MFKALRESRNCFRSLTTLKMIHAFLEAFPRFDGYNRGRRALRRDRKFHEVTLL
jgi:hypothetical protein